MSRIVSRSRIRIRRAAIVASALVGVALSVGMLLVLVDVGVYTSVRSDLQTAADSAALVAASQLDLSAAGAIASARNAAALHFPKSAGLCLSGCEVQRGTWDPDRRQFTPGQTRPNAVRVTARSSSGSQTPARTLGFLMSALPVSPQTTAVAALRPRDVVLVVDLSGLMNDDTEPCWATQALDRLHSASSRRVWAGREPGGQQATNQPGSQGNAQGSGSRLVRRMFLELGWGEYPGPSEHLGQPWGVADEPTAYAALARSDGPLTRRDVPPRYRIAPSDDPLACKKKAYSAVIDLQIARLMPEVVPAPDSTVDYEFWEQYLDYIVAPTFAAGRHGGRVALPPDQSPYRITGFGNPDALRFTLRSISAEPDAMVAPGEPASFCNRIGHVTYLQFLLDHGRDLRPGGRLWSPYAHTSPLCRWHREDTPAGVMRFPPAEQPLHSVRRALIATLHEIGRRNAEIADPGRRDRVAIVTFDALSSGAAKLAHPLSSDYAAAMRACTRLQAVGDKGPSTATESGLLAAIEQLRARSGDHRRAPADKIVVLVTGGPPDLYCTSPAQIDRFLRESPSGDFYPGEAYPANAAILQAMRMAELGWKLYPIGVGPRIDADFLDRLARAGNTADRRGRAPQSPLDPAVYEATLLEQLDRALAKPSPRIVQ